MKKFRYIIIAMIMAGIFLTACGSGGEEEAAEQESQTEEQHELPTESQSDVQAELQTESQPDVQVELQTEAQTEQEVKMNHDNWAQAYLSVIDELRKDKDLDRLDFSLLYVDDDDIPELVFGPDGYWVSVYTWQDGQVYTVMDQWAYGLWGRFYSYVPFQNNIKSYVYGYSNQDDDGVTVSDYDEFYQMAETTYELEYIYELIVENNIKFGDEAGGMEPSTMYYVEPHGTKREITEEEYHTYYAQAEEYIELRGDSTADEIINELVKASQLLSNNKGEAESTLPDITWDDYHSGSYETWLHFSFSDGSQIDKELQYSPSTVEKVDFADITGDGTDEVLVYRYFANTATEYTLINFFRIEENGVTEISPESELEELADNVWSVIDADFSKKEYDMPVLTMESYVKENMLVYVDKKVLVGYQDSRWQILEWFDGPKPEFE
ncbi:MAG: hypothetical protein K2O32_16360 [Acetatifactor sp.]|nr:hypothetical protein [Acetatifactor sp.]